MIVLNNNDHDTRVFIDSIYLTLEEKPSLDSAPQYTLSNVNRAFGFLNDVARYIYCFKCGHAHTAFVEAFYCTSFMLQRDYRRKVPASAQILTLGVRCWGNLDTAVV